MGEKHTPLIKKNGVPVGRGWCIDFIEGQNVTITVTAVDSQAEPLEANVTIAATAGGQGTPSDTVVGEIGFSQSSTAGVATAYSRGDHTHGSEPHDSHANLTGVTADQHHAQSHTHASHTGIGTDDHHAEVHAIGGADHSGTLAHTALSSVTADQHHAQSHVLATGTALGADHTISGANAGEVLRALSGTTAAFDQLAHADLGSVTADQHHAQAHSITGADHTGFPGGTTTFLRADATFATPPSGSATISSADIAFTDGDTMRRVAIADAAVGATSKVVGTIRRPDVDDINDPGYLYTHSIVKVYAGGFDLLAAAHGWGFDDPVTAPPNETVKFYYLVG